MRAMVLRAPRQRLVLEELPLPAPQPGELLLKVHACGICRTDLHVLDGDLKEPSLPIVLGHQIVATVVDISQTSGRFEIGDRVGVPWLGWSCGECRFCKTERENLCDAARYTGYQINGGLAEYTLADERFCFPIPSGYPDVQAAPLLCAGLIGYRALGMTGDAQKIGFYGFGASAHILLQVARYQRKEVFAFSRPGDVASQQFAEKLGAVWVGDSLQSPPTSLDAAIIFAPAGHLVTTALSSIARGGVVVCAGIHMSDIPSFPYSILWGERSIRSVANLTRRDGEEFLALAPKVPVKTEVHSYPLEKADVALDDLRNGRFNGAAVITVS